VRVFLGVEAGLEPVDDPEIGVETGATGSGAGGYIGGIYVD